MTRVPSEGTDSSREGRSKAPTSNHASAIGAAGASLASQLSMRSTTTHRTSTASRSRLKAGSAGVAKHCSASSRCPICEVRFRPSLCSLTRGMSCAQA